MINFAENINLDISNLKFASQKDTVLNTVMEFVKFWFPNINEILDTNVKDYFRLKNDLSMINYFLTYKNRIVIPDTLRKSVMNMLHGGDAGSAAIKLQQKEYCFFGLILIQILKKLLNY